MSLLRFEKSLSIFSINPNLVGVHFLTSTYDPGGTWIRSSTFDCTTGQISKIPQVGKLTTSHIIVENVNHIVIGTGVGVGLQNTIRNAKIGLDIVLAP